MPIQRRLPKFGFKNPTRVEFRPVNVAALQALSETLGTNVITLDTMVDAGLVSPKDLVKVLGNGEITTAVTVTADAFSKSAVAKIEAAGGKAVVNE
jgi:large subunit ribosomal protein L15